MYISLDRNVGGSPVGVQRSRGVLSVVFYIPKCTSQFGFSLDRKRTGASYASQWNRFVAWCEASGRSSLPASPDDVAAYL